MTYRHQKTLIRQLLAPANTSGGYTARALQRDVRRRNSTAGKACKERNPNRECTHSHRPHWRALHPRCRACHQQGCRTLRYHPGQIQHSLQLGQCISCERPLFEGPSGQAGKNKPKIVMGDNIHIKIALYIQPERIILRKLSWCGCYIRFFTWRHATWRQLAAPSPNRVNR